MKLGIALLATGVILLVLSVPYLISAIVIGFTQLQGGNVSGGIPAYLGIAAVIIGLLLTGIGAVRVFKQ